MREREKDVITKSTVDYVGVKNGDGPQGRVKI